MTADGMSGTARRLAAVRAGAEQFDLQAVARRAGCRCNGPISPAPARSRSMRQGRVFTVERTCTDPGLRPVSGACADNAPRVVQLAPERKVLAEQVRRRQARSAASTIVAADGYGGAYLHAGRPVSCRSRRQGQRRRRQGNGLFTNGLVLSPDGKTLYVTNRQTIVAFDVAADGSRRTAATSPRSAASRRAASAATAWRSTAEGRLYVTGGRGHLRVRQGRQAARRDPHAAARDHTRLCRRRQEDALRRHDGRGYAGRAQHWATPQGVRNVAMTVYKVKTLAAGPKDRPK